MLSEDGYVSIVGRGKDLIISGGLNIYPKEIEDVLNDQKGVVESAVVGVPHSDFGEGIVAVLVGEGTLDMGALEIRCRKKLAALRSLAGGFSWKPCQETLWVRSRKSVTDEYADSFSCKHPLLRYLTLFRV